MTSEGGGGRGERYPSAVRESNALKSKTTDKSHEENARVSRLSEHKFEIDVAE